MIDLHAFLVDDFEHSFRIEATAVHRGARKITAFASRQEIVRENRREMFLVTQDAAHKGFLC